MLGKPSPEFFTVPLEALGRGPETALVVGDDLAVDIGGERALDAATVLVRSGKGDRPQPGAEAEPDAVIDSIADLPTSSGPDRGMREGPWRDALVARRWCLVSVRSFGEDIGRRLTGGSGGWCCGRDGGRKRADGLARAPVLELRTGGCSDARRPPDRRSGAARLPGLAGHEGAARTRWQRLGRRDRPEPGGQQRRRRRPEPARRSPPCGRRTRRQCLPGRDRLRPRCRTSDRAGDGNPVRGAVRDLPAPVRRLHRRGHRRVGLPDGP